MQSSDKETDNTLYEPAKQCTANILLLLTVPIPPDSATFFTIKDTHCPHTKNLTTDKSKQQ
jgi:hypothetical protein